MPCFCDEGEGGGGAAWGADIGHAADRKTDRLDELLEIVKRLEKLHEKEPEIL
ncbi:MAG: hypothetical protein FWE98_06130 [Oscillospiraceae bacterium]|nr:hypothetical protein [Oscillospiraceae bacterium]